MIGQAHSRLRSPLRVSVPDEREVLSSQREPEAGSHPAGAREGHIRSIGHTPIAEKGEILEPAKRITVFIGEDARFRGRPLFEVLVLAAKEQGLVGATVFKGFMGYRANSGVSTAKILRLAENLPVVVEMIGDEERVQSFLPFLSRVVKDGVIACSDVALEQVGAE